MNSPGSFDAELTTVASRDPIGIETLIRTSHWVTAGSPTDREAARHGRLHGLLLHGGDADLPFPANPWNIPADAGLSQALRHVWDPIAKDCPNFITALHEEVFGLGLIRGADTWLLAYLYLYGHDGRAGALTDLAELPGRTPQGGLDVLWGGAPVPYGPRDVVAALGEAVPVPIRRLAAVHSSLGGTSVTLNFREFSTVSLGDSIREDYDGEDPQDYSPDHDFRRAVRGEFDRCLPLGRFEGRADYLDLDSRDLDQDSRDPDQDSHDSGASNPDSRDPDGIPRVVDVDFQEGVGTRTTPLWTWFDESAACYIFSRD